VVLDTGGVISPKLVDWLLARSAPLEQGPDLLRSANLLNADDPDRLLDVADRLVHIDPGKAHRLADLCATSAEACDLPAAAARSAYIRLQTHFAKGEFDAALRMANEAYEAYMASGRILDALRTHVGRMSVLLELGLYGEVLDAGQVVLDAHCGGWDRATPRDPARKRREGCRRSARRGTQDRPHGAVYVIGGGGPARH
jgi:hypothetical protein